MWLQETKCGQSNENTIESFWGNSDFKFIQKDSVGASGGILTIWDTNIFSFKYAIEGEFFLAICGSWAGYDSDIALINVYGPHSSSKKRRFWIELTSLTNSLTIPLIIFGDFNEDRNKTECMNSEYNQHWADNFNNFINNAGLIDLPLGGKRFTRICEKTMKFSKLDRFLVSDSIFTLWPNTSSKTLDRDLSDHCPIILRNNPFDSGPKPIRMFDTWLNLKDADTVIERAWSIPLTDNQLLESKFSEKEIWEAISNCDSSKAPGPDGFNMKFFKKHWELIKNDLIKSLDWFWDNSEISKGCNASFFTLIPKNSNPIGLNEYRPICLIGSYYKILTKFLSNRLAKFIHKVIGPEQTAFLKGCNILDSVLIANEIIDELKRKKQKGLIFKVDF
ncbi:uncharacterized protein [Rutidosis leptorrhynchoides]|uniref:uncharacterized protein n=1 Tax=Rutidosis leptorrhynchoides TaxID=125765 RepID=UPI003A996899